MLGVGRRSAVAAGEDLAVGEEARREQVRGAGERRGKRIDRRELQLRTVGEMRADARDVIHGGWRNRSIVAIFTRLARTRTPFERDAEIRERKQERSGAHDVPQPLDAPGIERIEQYRVDSAWRRARKTSEVERRRGGDPRALRRA